MASSKPSKESASKRREGSTTSNAANRSSWLQKKKGKKADYSQMRLRKNYICSSENKHDQIHNE